MTSNSGNNQLNLNELNIKESSSFTIVKLSNDHEVAVYIFEPIPEAIVDGKMFFFHGVGGCAGIWEEQIKYFRKKGWYIISMDYIGHGNSCKNYKKNDYLFSNLSKDVLEVFDKYSHPNYNVIVGHSYGCSMSCFIANERMDRIKSMILVSGGSPDPLGDVPTLFYCSDCFLYSCHGVIIQIFKWKSFKRSSGTGIREKKEVAVNLDYKVLKSVMRGQIWLEGDDEFHSKLFIPTLLIYGREDEFINDEDELEMLSTLPIAQYRSIPHTGHMVMMEEPDLVSNLINDHINKDWSSQLNLLKPIIQSLNTNNKEIKINTINRRKKHYPYIPINSNTTTKTTKTDYSTRSLKKSSSLPYKTDHTKIKQKSQSTKIINSKNKIAPL